MVFGLGLNEESMKKAERATRDELCREYKRSDFPGSLVRGKYAKRLRDSSNVVVLKPEVAEAFPNEEAVDNALLSLMEVARATAPPTRRPRRRTASHG